MPNVEGYKRYPFNWSALASNHNTVLSCAMLQTEPISMPPAKLAQRPQFYLSTDSPRSFSPMILDMPPPTSSASQNSSVPLTDSPKNFSSVLCVDAAVTPRASKSNHTVFIPDNPTELSPFEDALVEEFMNSIAIFGPNIDGVSGSDNRDVENGEYGHPDSCRPSDISIRDCTTQIPQY
jgi:hypothetical protein